MRSELFIGLDLGQRHDPSAIAIIERSEHIAERPDPITWARERTIRHSVRHIETLPLNTPYPAVEQRITRLCRAASTYGPTTLIVDATGVGAPVVDALRIPGSTWRLIPVMIGSGFNQTQTDNQWRVPKRDLIAGLPLALESDHLKIANLKQTRDLTTQLTQMKSIRRQSGATQYTSPTKGHDDLVIALSLAWWAIETRRPSPLGVNHPLP